MEWGRGPASFTVRSLHRSGFLVAEGVVALRRVDLPRPGIEPSPLHCQADSPTAGPSRILDEGETGQSDITGV